MEARLINGPEELDLAWLDGVENVGVTSGASDAGATGGSSRGGPRPG